MKTAEDMMGRTWRTEDELVFIGKLSKENLKKYQKVIYSRKKWGIIVKEDIFEEVKRLLREAPKQEGVIVA